MVSGDVAGEGMRVDIRCPGEARFPVAPRLRIVSAAASRTHQDGSPRRPQSTSSAALSGKERGGAGGVHAHEGMFVAHAGADQAVGGGGQRADLEESAQRCGAHLRIVVAGEPEQAVRGAEQLELSRRMQGAA